MILRKYFLPLLLRSLGWMLASVSFCKAWDLPFVDRRLLKRGVEERPAFHVSLFRSLSVLLRALLTLAQPHVHFPPTPWGRHWADPDQPYTPLLWSFLRLKPSPFQDINLITYLLEPPQTTLSFSTSYSIRCYYLCVAKPSGYHLLSTRMWHPSLG